MHPTAQQHTARQRAVPSGFEPIGVAVAARRQGMGGQGSRARDAILRCIAQFAQEFGDRASLKSSTSRAYNLFARSSMPQEQFINCLWEARAITREHASTLRKPIRAKMGYFFSVLSERLGLKDDQTSQQKGSNPAREQGSNTS